MRKSNWKVYAFWIALTEAVGALAGLLTSEGTKLYGETIIKPALSPPALVFPIVWSILYAVMGFGAARVYQSRQSDARTTGIRIYLVQLAFNFFWSIIFFNLQAFGFAFVWLLFLLVTVLLCCVLFYYIDERAGKLLVPYLLWLFFAAYLNLGVALLN